MFRVLAYTAFADRTLQDEEKPVLVALAKRLRLSVPRAQEILAQVQAEGAGASLQLPSDPAEQHHVFEAMLDVALADGFVAPEERALLEHVGGALGIQAAQIAAILQTRLSSGNPPTDVVPHGFVRATCRCGLSADFPEAARGRLARCGACGETLSVGPAPKRLEPSAPKRTTDLRPLFYLGGAAALLLLLGGIAIVANRSSAPELTPATQERCASHVNALYGALAQGLNMDARHSSARASLVAYLDEIEADPRTTTANSAQIWTILMRFNCLRETGMLRCPINHPREADGSFGFDPQTYVVDADACDYVILIGPPPSPGADRTLILTERAAHPDGTRSLFTPQGVAFVEQGALAEGLAEYGIDAPW